MLTYLYERMRLLPNWVMAVFTVVSTFLQLLLHFCSGTLFSMQRPHDLAVIRHVLLSMVL